MIKPGNLITATYQEFRDLIERGDDFYKIELWRPARAWYKRALELNIEPENVKKKIAECDRLLAYEVKVIWILAAVLLSIIVLIFLF